MASSSRAPTKTSLIQSVRDYIARMASDVSGMKALYFVRPTHENVRLLQEEFKEPKYGEYHLFFSNTTRDAMIQQLAEADEHEVVQQVQEYYADFLAINSDLASLSIPSTVALAREQSPNWDQPTFDRLQQRAHALLQPIKRRLVPVGRLLARERDRRGNRERGEVGVDREKVGVVLLHLLHDLVLVRLGELLDHRVASRVREEEVVLAVLGLLELLLQQPDV